MCGFASKMLSICEHVLFFGAAPTPQALFFLDKCGRPNAACAFFSEHVSFGSTARCRRRLVFGGTCVFL